MNRPHAHHFVYSLPPGGVLSSLGAARRATNHPHAHHFVYALPPKGALSSLGAARREDD